MTVTNAAVMKEPMARMSKAAIRSEKRAKDMTHTSELEPLIGWGDLLSKQRKDSIHLNGVKISLRRID